MTIGTLRYEYSQAAPPARAMIFIPQIPYMTIGTLRYSQSIMLLQYVNIKSKHSFYAADPVCN